MKVKRFLPFWQLDFRIMVRFIKRQGFEQKLLGILAEVSKEKVLLGKPCKSIREAKEEEGVKKSTFDLKWSYGLDTKFSEGDKLNIYLKGTKKPEDSEDNTEETDKKKESNTTTSSEYVKIHTIETDIISVTSFNLDNFVSENMDYSVMIEPVSEKFTIGGGKTKFSVDKIVHTKPVDHNQPRLDLLKMLFHKHYIRMLA